MAYWLMKSEPTSYSIDALKRDKREMWDGVRNYQARNFMRDEMRKGDIAFFYHSNCAEPGIYGVMTICSNPYPDPTQFDTKSKYYDSKATKEKPRWFLVDVCYKRSAKQPLLLSEIRADERLANMWILRPGSRLSITPVTEREGEYIFSKI